MITPDQARKHSVRTLPPSIDTEISKMLSNSSGIRDFTVPNDWFAWEKEIVRDANASGWDVQMKQINGGKDGNYCVLKFRERTYSQDEI